MICISKQIASNTEQMQSSWWDWVGVSLEADMAAAWGGGFSPEKTLENRRGREPGLPGLSVLAAHLLGV